MQPRIRSLITNAIIVASLVPAAQLLAAPASFTLDTAQSTLSMSGTVSGAALQQQGAGALSTTYSGNFLLDLSPQSIQFISGGAATANNSGTWQPLADGTAGSSLANYGAQFTISFITTRAAVRNLVADAFSDPIPLNPDLTFAASQATVVVTSGDVAYRNLVTSGTNSLAGSSGGNTNAPAGTIAINRNAALSTATIVAQIPVATTVVGTIDLIGPATINFNGSYRGTVTSIYGDTNFDKSVNLTDFTTLAANFGKPGNWLAGDFSGNGNIELADFTALAANFGLTAPRSAVPEPATIATGGLAIAGLLISRRKRARHF